MAGKRGRQEAQKRTGGRGRANWNHPEQHNEYSGVRMTNEPPPHPDEGSGSNFSPGYQNYLLNRSHGRGEGYRTPPAYGDPCPGSNAVVPQSRHGYRTPPCRTPAPGSNALSPQHSANRNYALCSGRLTTFDRLGFGQEPQRIEYADHDDQMQSHHPIVHRHAPLGMPRRLGSGPEEFQRPSWDHTHRRRPSVQQNLSPRGSSPSSSISGSASYTRGGWLPSELYSPTNPAWSPPQQVCPPTNPQAWSSLQAEPEVWTRPSRSQSCSPPPNCNCEPPPSNQWSNCHNQSPQSSHYHTTLPSPEPRDPAYS